MSEFRKRGSSIGVIGLVLLIGGIVGLVQGQVAAGAIFLGFGAWLLGVAAMYLDPPCGKAIEVQAVWTKEEYGGEEKSAR